MNAVGYVYAIESGDAVKIGWSANPLARMNGLKATHPGRLRLLGFVPASRRQERELHHLCEAQKIRGEWFRKDGAVIHFLSILPAPKPILMPAKRTYIPRSKRENGLERALIAVEGVSGLARALCLTRQAVSQWDKIPAERVPEIEGLTGVPRHELRPDLWDAPHAEAAE
jgi:Putative antitoxin of bacterial toxin-antitoxin system, YdaS/YdaT/T5orf172 domain